MRRNFLARITFLSCAIMIAIAASISLALLRSRDETLEDTRKEAGNIATVLAGQVSFAVRSIDLVLEQTIDRLRESDMPNVEAFRQTLGAPQSHDFLVDRLKQIGRAHV